MYAKKLTRALSLTLAVIMAVTMFTCCAFSVSAEDTTEETFVPYEGYTWSPLRDVTHTQGTTTTETTETENVPLAEAEELAAVTGNATKTIETVDNGDGTVTANKVTTTHTYVANDDGETATVTTTVTKEPHTFVNPLSENSEFKFGIYSDRANVTKGVWYATDFQGYQIYATSYNPTLGSANNVHSNIQHKINIVPDDTDGLINVTRSFYATETQTSAMENVLIFGIRLHNELYLEFTAPEDGVYTASGVISKLKAGSTTVDEGVVDFYLAKVDENGVEHAVSEIANLPDYITNTTEIPNDKVELKAGEKLVLRTENNEVDFVGKVFIENYLVTKWDYAEAEDNSTVTVNYSYKNNNFYNVYGENYALSDTYYDTLWTARAAKFQIDYDELDTTEPTKEFNKMKDYGVFANGADFASPATGGTQNPGIWYDTSTGALTAKLFWGNGTDSVTRRNGLQFTFTMPEDGSVVLTGASKDSGDNTIARVGIKKKDSDEVVYGLYYVKGGTTYNDKVTGVRGNWSQLRYVTGTNYREHTIGELEAGDVIYYEMCMFGDVTGQKYHDLSTLNVAITTSNSVADFNGDFKADATDVAYLRKVLLRKVTPVDRTIFNITEDDSVNLRDLVRIKKLLSEDVVEDAAGESATEDTTT